MKILKILLISFFLAHSASSNENRRDRIELEKWNVVRGHDITDEYFLKTICIDSYLWLQTIYGFGKDKTLDLDQFFVEVDGKSLPARCKNY